MGIVAGVRLSSLELLVRSLSARRRSERIYFPTPEAREKEGISLCSFACYPILPHNNNQSTSSCCFICRYLPVEQTTRMSHNELLAQFQMVTGTADTVSRQFLSRAHWNLEAALSAYFDAGLDPPTEMIAPPPSALPPPPVQLELGELPVAALYDKRNKTRATLRGVRVRGLVQDLLAELRVEFRFHNATDNPIEALYATT